MAVNLSIPCPRLLVRTTRDAGGRIVPVLVDSEGVPLPCQSKVGLFYDCRGVAEVTVTFVIDGDAIQMVPDNIEAAQ